MWNKLFNISLINSNALTAVGNCVKDVLLVAQTRLQLRLQNQVHILWVDPGAVCESWIWLVTIQSLTWRVIFIGK